MKQLHPRAVWLLFVTIFWRSFTWVIILGVWAFFMFFEETNESFVFTDFINWGLLILVVSLVVSYIWAKLSYYFYRYELSTEGFRKERGVIWKKYTTIPYDRIQNVDISRGILARLLGLSVLLIQTAGMSGVVVAEGYLQGYLPGLSKNEAEQLRSELISRAKQSRGQGL